MPSHDYDEALRLGKKNVQDCEEEGLPTTLPALDAILDGVEIRGAVPLGLMDVPAERFVGTKTVARAASFAPNFMPILDAASEFAMKWMSLCDSHLAEGIRDPVVAYEYLHLYYVMEGNKRVSVLKYFDAAVIPAYVTRLIPAWKDEKEIRIYYEFLEFYNKTNISDIEFSRERQYAHLTSMTGHKIDERWSREDRDAFLSCYGRFSEAFSDLGGEELSCTVGDAFVTYLWIYGYEEALQETIADFTENLEKIWEEIEIIKPNEDLEEKLEVKLDPTPDSKKKGIISIFTGSSADKTVMNIAFLYSKNKMESSWTYGHELGRLYLEDVFRGSIHTTVYNDVTEENADAALELAVEDENTIIFATSPLFLTACIKAAADHPEVKILNCSLNQVHKYIRTYYARIFEAKLLNGILAGILTDTDRIGYIADYPIASVPAAIDAFALGVKMVNPRAKVLLEWTTVQENSGVDLTQKLADQGATYISQLDMIVPRHAEREYGLFHLEDGKLVNLALPVVDWGKFYEQIIQNVRYGTWKIEDRMLEDKAVSYFWGMSSGVVDIVFSDALPPETRNLIGTLKRTVKHNVFSPFRGSIPTQDGVIQTGPQGLSTQDIISIDWLADNVIGRIPAIKDMAPDKRPVVRQEGVHSVYRHTEE